MAQNYSAAIQPTPIASPGATVGTDWEQRVDFARLRATTLWSQLGGLATAEPADRQRIDEPR